MGRYMPLKRPEVPIVRRSHELRPILNVQKKEVIPLVAMPEKRRDRSFPLLVLCMKVVSFLLVFVTALIVLFVNPINWKLYDQFKTVDWVWVFVSNIGIVGIAAVVWWFAQKKLTKMIAKKNDTCGRMHRTNRTDA